MSYKKSHTAFSIYLIFWILYIPLSNFDWLVTGYRFSIASYTFFVWVALGSLFSTYQLIKLGFNYDFRFMREGPLDKGGITRSIENTLNNVFKTKYRILLQPLKFKILKMQVISMGALSSLQIYDILDYGFKGKCSVFPLRKLGCQDAGSIYNFIISWSIFASIIYVIFELFEVMGIDQKNHN